MKKVEEEIKSYFEPKEIPPINEEKIKELQTETLKNKRKKSFWYSFKKYGFAATCLLMIVVGAILIPTIARKEEKFYADDEATIVSESLTLEYTSNYIQENYPVEEYRQILCVGDGQCSHLGRKLADKGYNVVSVDPLARKEFSTRRNEGKKASFM